MTKVPDDVADLLRFIDSSPTAFHATRSAAKALEQLGFQALDEREPWTLQPGQRCYVTRSDSSIVAFVVGDQSPATAGFSIIGAHTDSPHLRLKPNASQSCAGWNQLAVEPYGGLLLYTWPDRDLSIAGRVVVRRPNGAIDSLLVDFRKPIARVPSLAIHLDREVNQKGLQLNPQHHLAPIVGISGDRADEDWLGTLLAQQIAREHQTGIEPSDIVGFDLGLYDTQPPSVAGAHDELILSARLDNLASCHAALRALSKALDMAPTTADTRLLAFWDHEECGSRSMQGAQGPFVRSVVERVVESAEPASREALARAMAASQLVSVDMAHAVHPNFVDRHEPGHMPLLGHGPVLKFNSNQSYATDGLSAARFTSLCRDAGFEPQRFVVRSDMPCGSTIGPITAALMGIKTVDVGNPMLSMHSIREMAGMADHGVMIEVLARFLSGPKTDCP